MISTKQIINHKQKRIGFKRPVFFIKEDENQNEEDQLNITDAESDKNNDEKEEIEEEKIDMTKMKIPTSLESDQNLKISSSLFDGFDWIHSEQEIFDDIDQDIQIPENFLMPF